MGFKNKKSKVKQGYICGRGRQPGKFAGLDKEEKRQYKYDTVYKSRYGKDRPKTANQVVSSSGDCDASMSHSVGRPPLNLVAMSPNKLRVRKSSLMRKKRKQQRLSNIRRSAVMNRWNNENDCDSELEDETVCCNESSNDEESDKDENDPGKAGHSRTTLWRRKCQMRGVLTNNPIDNLHILLSFNQIFQIDNNLAEEIRKIHHPSDMTERQYRYRANKMRMIFIDSSFQHDLMVYWMDQLLSPSIIEAIFNHCGASVPQEYLPKSFIVSQHTATIASRFVSPSSRSAKNVRTNSINYIVAVAKECGLSFKKLGDALLLAKAVYCSPEFAAKVLRFIDDGKEEDLYQHHDRVDAIKSTEWPNLIKEYVFLPENTRSVPGQQQVSVRYGVHLPKFILLRSRKCIASDFKAKYPECPFKIPTIIREFPQNAVTPTSRDIERNTCPIHANVRRLVNRINRVFRKKGFNNLMLPSSCRELASSAMCQSPMVSFTEPTSWNIDCVMNKCSLCPGLEIAVPEDFENLSISYSLWETKMVEVTKVDVQNSPKTVKKSVFSLYTYTETVLEALRKLRLMVEEGLKWHIYTSHRQWTAHEVQRSNLDTESVITIEDYQMNMEVIYRENPTSLAYSTNKKAVALYPICVEFLNTDGQLCKGAIAFLSEDKKHDHQQVEQFEKRAFNIIREKVGRPINHWKRFSDGCAGQFRSRFVAAQMFEMKQELELSSISYDLFEANEGKNTSDTIGSIVKCAFLRAMYQKDEGVSSIEDIVSLIQGQLSSSMKKFEFFVVESFDFIERKTNRNELMIPHLSKIHSLVLNAETIIPRYWTCLQCRLSKVCTDCQLIPAVAKSKMLVVTNDESEDDYLESFHDTDDIGGTDQSDSEESADEAEDEVGPGDIVWALYGRRWYPAKLLSVSDLPHNIKGSFRNPRGKFIVKWFVEDRFSLVNKVEPLAENRLDAQRAGQSKNILEAYNLALEELNN